MKNSPKTLTFPSLELLPCMDQEMRILHHRAADAHDMLVEIMDSLGLDG